MSDHMTATLLVPIRVEAPPLSDQWLIGFNAYCDGKVGMGNESVNWQNGWWSALAAEARASVEDTLDYEYDIEDREWWRKGQW